MVIGDITRRDFFRILGAAGVWLMSNYYHNAIQPGDDVADYVINDRLGALDQAVFNAVTSNQFQYLGINATPANNIRLLINAQAANVAGLDIRGGGQTGRGWPSDPTNGQGLVYLTHKMTNPPVGLLGMMKGYMAYSGSLANVSATMEALEIVAVIQGATSGTTQYLVAAEIVAGLNNGGGNMSALTFSHVTGILADVNAATANCGTVTWARSLQALFPSMLSTGGGNTLVNAAALYVDSAQAQSPSVTPTNAYGAYINLPAAGTNAWAIYATGKVEIGHATNVRMKLDPSSTSQFGVTVRNQADTAYKELLFNAESVTFSLGTTGAAAGVAAYTTGMIDLIVRVRQAAPNTTPSDGIINAGQISFYLDESTHKLKVKAKYANGTTVKIGEVALT